MAERSLSINDETNRSLSYYLSHSERDWDSVINEAIKYCICDHLTQKQVHETMKHAGEDAFSTDEVLRDSNSSWMNGDA